MKYRTGTLYNKKHAVWFKHSINLTCRLCPQLDSALHSLPGCQNTQIRNMITERHNLACSMIFKAISKTGSLGSCFVSSWLCKIMRFLIQLKLRLYQSGSFHPASHTEIGLPRLDAVLVAPTSAKTRKQQTSNEGGWVLRSGRGQVRGAGSTSAAPPATSRSAFPRQHLPKDLSIL